MSLPRFMNDPEPADRSTDQDMPVLQICSSPVGNNCGLNRSMQRRLDLLGDDEGFAILAAQQAICFVISGERFRLGIEDELPPGSQ